MHHGLVVRAAVSFGEVSNGFAMRKSQVSIHPDHVRQYSNNTWQCPVGNFAAVSAKKRDKHGKKIRKYLVLPLLVPGTSRPAEKMGHYYLNIYYLIKL